MPPCACKAKETRVKGKEKRKVKEEERGEKRARKRRKGGGWSGDRAAVVGRPWPACLTFVEEVVGRPLC